MDPRALPLKAGQRVHHTSRVVDNYRRLVVDGQARTGTLRTVVEESMLLTVADVEDKRLTAISALVVGSTEDYGDGPETGPDAGKRLEYMVEASGWTVKYADGSSAKERNRCHPLEHNLLPDTRLKAGQEVLLDPREVALFFDSDLASLVVGQARFTVSEIKRTSSRARCRSSWTARTQTSACSSRGTGQSPSTWTPAW